MTPELYTEVVLNRDVPEQGVHQGDVGLYIEYLAPPQGDEAGAILEMTIDGEWRLVTVPISAISPNQPTLITSAGESASNKKP